MSAFLGTFAQAPETIDIERIRTTVAQFHDLDSVPKGVLWNSGTEKIIVTVEAEKLAKLPWRYLFGLKENREELETEWGAIVAAGSSKGTLLNLPNPPA